MARLKWTLDRSLYAALRSNLMEDKSLTVMIQESMGDGTLRQLFDREIVDDASMGVALRAAELATLCSVMPGNRRPAMRRVAEELQQLAD